MAMPLLISSAFAQITEFRPWLVDMATLLRSLPRLVPRTSGSANSSSSWFRQGKSFGGLCFVQYSTKHPLDTLDEPVLPQPIDRSHETPQVTRARLLYQSRKRGILETDLLLSTFADKYLSCMSIREMQEYDQAWLTFQSY